MTIVEGGSDMNLVELYTLDEDDNQEYGKNRYLAQTFTLDVETVVWRFRLKSWTTFGGFTYHYDLHNTDGTGKPIGVPIASTTLSPTGEERYSPGKWRRFDFSSFPKLPAGIYAIVASVPDSPQWTTHKLRKDATASPYVRGKAWLSHDAGTIWNELVNEDFMFEVWGYVPPPEPPPAPVVSNWAPVDYTRTSLLEGFTVVITTDIPVHLFMRWTDKPPLKHDSVELRRGINLMTGVRYCFVAWTENEQLEPGDTLIHTFQKRNWPVCQTRWFYFVGTKQAEEQPSASPIFHLHRVAEFVPATYGPVAGTLSNRTIQKNHAVWDNCHDAAAGVILPWHVPPQSFLYTWERLTATYWLRRSFLFFDTSPIPPGSLITGATLSIYCLAFQRTSSAADPYFCITQGVQQDPVVPTDFGAQLPETTIGGTKDFATFVIGQYNDIHFNANGLNFINPGGLTKLCLRGEQDIIDFAPPLGSNDVQYHSSQKGNGKQPLLTVYYVPP